MLEHMKAPHIDICHDHIRMMHAGISYVFPKKIAEQYRVTELHIDANDIFAHINKKYTKPGALLKGIRMREEWTQIAMAKHISVTQSDISQMENGTRSIGKKIARRLEKLFGVDYRSFLA